MELTASAAITERREDIVEPTPIPDLGAADETLAGETLVEEICVDGMCGVY